MASTTFVDNTTPVVAAWLNDVNGLAYRGQFPLTTQTWGIGAVPLTYASNGVSGYIYNAANTGTVTSNALLRLHSVNRNANVQLISIDTGTASYSWLNQAGTFLGDMQYAYTVGDILWRTTPGGVATEMLRLTQAGILQPATTLTQTLGSSALEWSSVLTAQVNRFSAGALTINSSNAAGTITFRTASVDKMTISSAGNCAVVGEVGTLGYGTGSGGTVTQLTSKGTAVTLNKGCGQIIMNNAALAAGAIIGFPFNNSLLAATDVLVVNVVGGVTAAGDYTAFVSGGSIAGQCAIAIRNNTAGSLSQAVVIGFAIIKAVTS